MMQTSDTNNNTVEQVHTACLLRLPDVSTLRTFRPAFSQTFRPTFANSTQCGSLEKIKYFRLKTHSHSIQVFVDFIKYCKEMPEEIRDLISSYEY